MLIKDEKIAYDGYLKIHEAQVSLNKDSERQWQQSKLVKPNAVAILVFNKETQEFIFIRQFRYPVADQEKQYLLEIPAGTIDPNDESPKHTAIRELEEEVGYKTDDIEEILEYYPSIGYSSEKVHLFMAIVTSADKIKNKGGGLNDQGEFIETFSCTIQNAYEMMDYNFIKDAKTLIALQEFKIKHQSSMILENNKEASEVVESLENKIKEQQKKIHDLETKIILIQAKPKIDNENNK